MTLMDDLNRQNFSCYGCLAKINEQSAIVSKNGLLCRDCSTAVSLLNKNPANMRRLTAFLDHDRDKLNIYLIGSLKNQRIMEVGKLLRELGHDVMDEWITPGPEADENWQKYEKHRGRTYSEALRGRAATNIFLFDRSYIDLADIVIMVAPAGKSAMIELGYAKGRGKGAFIFLDGKDPERYDIMPNFADKVFFTESELLADIKQNQEVYKKGIITPQ